MKGRKLENKEFSAKQFLLNKNRKGFLLGEETLKIIIAVICIAFLAYFLVSLYLNNKTDNDLELAKSSLEHLVKEADAGNPEVTVYNPKNWFLISFPISNSILPLTCSNLNWKDCLCICDVEFYTARNSGISKDCDSRGTCLQSDLKVEGDKIKIKPPLALKINGGKITK